MRATAFRDQIIAYAADGFFTLSLWRGGTPISTGFDSLQEMIQKYRPERIVATVKAKTEFEIITSYGHKYDLVGKDELHILVIGSRLLPTSFRIVRGDRTLQDVGNGCALPFEIVRMMSARFC